MEIQNGIKKPNAAYAVLLTTNSYAIGAKVLAWSLGVVGTAYPLIVLYTPDTLSSEHIEDLKKLGCELRETTRIILSQETNFVTSNYSEIWTKLQIFGLIEFERVILLDADMLVRQNLDELMTLDLPESWIAASHACKCNPMKFAHYPPDWNPEGCAYTSYKKGHDMNGHIKATSGLDYFNSGLVVLKPSLSDLDVMKKTLVNLPNLTKYRFADQDFLNEVYKEKWIPLPYKYNALKTLRSQHSTMWDDDEVKNVHYILAHKPWDDLNWAKQSEEERIKDPFNVVTSWWFQAYDQMMTKIKKNS